MRKRFLFGFLIITLFAKGNNTLHGNFKEKFTPFAKYSFEIAKKLPILYFCILFHIICHEFGHAIAAKILFGNKINIHVGPGNKKIVFKIGCVNFHGYNPLLWATGGFTIVRPSATITINDPKELEEILKNPTQNFWQNNNFAKQIKNIKRKNFIINIAGGVFGIITDYLVLSGFAARNKYKQCKDIKKSIFYGLKNGIFPFKSIGLNKNLKDHELRANTFIQSMRVYVALTQMLYSFVPGNTGMLPKVNPGTDGTRAWQNLGINEKIIKVAAVVNWIANLSVPVALLFKGCKFMKKYQQENR